MRSPQREQRRPSDQPGVVRGGAQQPAVAGDGCAYASDDRAEQRGDQTDERVPDVRRATPFRLAASMRSAWRLVEPVGVLASYSLECFTSTRRRRTRRRRCNRPCTTTGMHSWKMPPGSPSYRTGIVTPLNSMTKW